MPLPTDLPTDLPPGLPTRLPPPWPGCALWGLDLRAPPAPAQLAWLDDHEQAEAARLSQPAARRRYQAAHVALRAQLARALGQGEPGALRLRPGVLGKPVLVDASHCHFSLSRRDDWGLLAIDAAPVGVDLEPLPCPSHPPDRADLALTARHHFSPAECQALAALPPHEQAPAFLRGWTRKEACLKALGLGLSMDPRGVEVGLGPEPCPPRLHPPGPSAPRLRLRLHAGRWTTPRLTAVYAVAGLLESS